MFHDYCIIEVCISFFFVLTSGRSLPVTTFFVFSKPLCSHFAVQIVIREFSAPLQQCCLSLSKGFPLQRETAKICYCCSQLFYSSFAALLEVILQRCSSAACFVRGALGIWLYWKLLFKFPSTRAKMPFKCPTLGSIQVIKCPHPRDISQAHKWQKDGRNAFSCQTKSL